MKKKQDDSVELHCDVPGLIDTVIKLIRSATDEDKRKLLQEYPELLSDAADDVLKQVEEVHRSADRVQDANSIDGLRFKLGRTRKYGFDHACMEQVVLAAFINMPHDNPGGYLAQVTSYYPELLRPEADRAMSALKEDLTSSKKEDAVMAIFLDVLSERVRAQRSRYAAMAQGNRQGKATGR
jgi:hypothetical protein